MTNFVLVAGAFHGAWAWEKVRPLLEAQGHVVHAVDLTGQGEKIGLATPDTNLSTHIDDVVRVIETENLSDVVLVGHSYSGLVVTGAADKVIRRVAHIVYTDATVPADGLSAADYAGPTLTQAALAAANGDWQVDNFFPIAKFGPFADVRAQESFTAKLVKHPMASFFEKIRLENPPVRRRTFVRSTLDPMALFETFAAHARMSPDWDYHEIRTGHDAMLTAPEALADILGSIELLD